MEIAIEIKFEQRGRVVGRTTGVGADGSGKPQGVEVERGDKGVEETHGIIGGDIVLQAFGKEQGLGAVQANAMIHACHRRPPGVKVSTMTEFSHRLAPEPTAVGAVRSAVAVHVASRRWLSLLCSKGII